MTQRDRPVLTSESSHTRVSRQRSDHANRQVRLDLGCLRPRRILRFGANDVVMRAVWFRGYVGSLGKGCWLPTLRRDAMIVVVVDSVAPYSDNYWCSVIAERYIGRRSVRAGRMIRGRISEIPAGSMLAIPNDVEVAES